MEKALRPNPVCPSIKPQRRRPDLLPVCLWYAKLTSRDCAGAARLPKAGVLELDAVKTAMARTLLPSDEARQQKPLGGAL
jgi:hypothetical protein